MKTFRVAVTQHLDVTLDETKFTPAFMEEFRAGFFPFHDIEDHVEHLAQLAGRGIVDDLPSSFIEGYGPAKEMGITFVEVDLETEILEISADIPA